MGSTIVTFNRKFTQSQLTAAEGTAVVGGVAVINGAWYVAKTEPNALYIGIKDSGSGDVILKKVSDIADGSINELNAVVTNYAAGATDAATSRTDSVQVVTGFTITETTGKLVQNDTTVQSAKVDMAGAADKAYTDAVSSSNAYADQMIAQAISGLGSLMHFEGTKSSISEIQQITSAKKGDVYICTSDASEWVCLRDLTAADPTAWEKFGTTDVAGALYKGDNVFTNETFIVADGTNGKIKAISDADIATRLNYKTKQNPVANSGSGYVSSVTQDANGVITVGKSAIPAVSGSVSSQSSDPDAWKTLVHDVAGSGHGIAGNTKTIPAATTNNDGYMTSTQVSNLSICMAALTWDE